MAHPEPASPFTSLSKMHRRPPFAKLSCLGNVKATYSWLQGSTPWLQALPTGSGFINTTPLVKAHQARRYSAPIKASPSGRITRQQRGSPWTKDEDEILTQGRAERLRFEEISPKLPGRSVTACSRHLYHLNHVRRSSPVHDHARVNERNNLRWSTEEHEILAQGLAKGLTYAKIAQKLPGRSVGTCMTRAFDHNLVSTKAAPWTTEEEGILAQGLLKGLRHTEIAQKLPGRTAAACRIRASLRNLSCKPGLQKWTRNKNPWTTEEDGILAQGLMKGLRHADIAQKLPGRTVRACSIRAQIKDLPRKYGPRKYGPQKRTRF